MLNNLPLETAAPDAIEVHTAVRQLAANEALVVTVRGACMQPLFGDGARLKVTALRRYWPGDIIVARHAAGGYSAHRLLGYHLRGRTLQVLTQGDTAQRPDALRPTTDILGRVVGGECQSRAYRIPFHRRIIALGQYVRHSLGAVLGRARRASLVVLLAMGLLLSGNDSAFADSSLQQFTIAVIPDTQNMVDYRHQRGQELDGFGEFPFDASEQFMGMLDYIARHSVSRGGDIVFAASVGDVWQHQSILMDEDHRARGFDYTRFSPVALSGEISYGEEVRQVEMPLAIKGYQALSEAGLPFGVAPGNHDYDAMWSDDSQPGSLLKVLFSDIAEDDPAVLGTLHIGGLDNFRSVFGAESGFFRGRDWYVASHGGGTSSAQLFAGGGYTFLHIALEMSPADEVLAWAQSIMDQYPGYPTIITTHDYLNTAGERAPNPLIDLAELDPERHNSAEQLFAKLIYPNDQVFLVLCGHHHGQALRTDRNQAGNEVWQVLADYQDRGQSLLDVDASIRGVGDRRIGIGDGWLRLMHFDFSAATPTLTVRTYSSHYKGFSTELAQYSQWYKAHEKPGHSDDEYLTADAFTLSLLDFRNRFPLANQVSGKGNRTDNGESTTAAAGN